MSDLSPGHSSSTLENRGICYLFWCYSLLAIQANKILLLTIVCVLEEMEYVHELIFIHFGYNTI